LCWCRCPWQGAAGLSLGGGTLTCPHWPPRRPQADDGSAQPCTAFSMTCREPPWRRCCARQRGRPCGRAGRAAGRATLVLLLALLLGTPHCARGVYFESAEQCGWDADAFVAFESDQRPLIHQLSLQSLGVCGYGLDLTGLQQPDRDGDVGRCVQCSFSPYALGCPADFRPFRREAWHLADRAKCEWANGCLDLPCPPNTLELDRAVCGPNGQMARRCCQARPSPGAVSRGCLLGGAT
jgi:hypothetical protein